MNDFQQPQFSNMTNQIFPAQNNPQLSNNELIQAYHMYYMQWYCHMMAQQRQSQGFKPVTIKVEQGLQDLNIKKQENCSEDDPYEFQNGENTAQEKIKNNQTRRGRKIKYKRKDNIRNTQKNLLVHLKLWIQKFVQEKSRTQPMIKKQFQRIFAGKAHKSSKDVYMNLNHLERVLQNEILRPCLKQFFQGRVLRYLMNSNIQNKICIMKYMPILLKKYTQRKCQSLKQ